LCLYDFWTRTQVINQRLIAKCPTVLGMIDKDAKKRAQQLCAADFPDVAKLRYVAAHPAEAMATPDKMKRHAADAGKVGPPFSASSTGTVLMQGCMVGDRYASTIEGRLVSYAPNGNSVSSLALAMFEWGKAFSPVREKTLRSLAERAAENPPPQPPD